MVAISSTELVAAIATASATRADRPAHRAQLRGHEGLISPRCRRTFRFHATARSPGARRRVRAYSSAVISIGLFAACGSCPVARRPTRARRTARRTAMRTPMLPLMLDPDPVDPALCPVGVANGCCPLVGRGGSDPNCPSRVSSFVHDDVIVLDDPALLDPRRRAISGTGSGRDGVDREAARARVGSSHRTDRRGPDRQVVFETRAADGVLVGPERHTTADLIYREDAGSTALELDATSKRYVFVDTEERYRAVGYPLGVPTYTTLLGEFCLSTNYIHGFRRDQGSSSSKRRRPSTCSTYQPRVDVLAAGWDRRPLRVTR